MLLRWFGCSVRDEDIGSKILTALGDDDDQPRAQVAAIVSALGDGVALDLLDEVRHIEANGGDADRRR